MIFCRIAQALAVQMNGLGLLLVMSNVLVDGYDQLRHARHFTLVSASWLNMVEHGSALR